MNRALLSVTDLSIGREGREPIVAGVDIELDAGEAVGIVGESGSGKTLVSKAITGILPVPLVVRSGSIRLFDRPAPAPGDRGWRALRGSRIAAVFQDPGSYLDPSYTVGAALNEVLRRTERLSRAEARVRAIRSLTEVRIADPEAVLARYPRELSGGMAQRVVLALALIRRPEVLIADEITTALDVTVAAEIVDLLLELRAEHRMSMVVVSHDLSIVSRLTTRLIVLHRGRVIESGETATLLRRPRTDYLRELIEQYTRHDRRRPTDPAAAEPEGTHRADAS